ncbi:MAG: GumC family protein [Oceanicaulis sp.]
MHVPKTDAFDHSGGADSMIGLSELILILRRRLALIVMVAALVIGGVAAYTFSLTNEYTATTRLLIEPRQRQAVDMDAVLSGLPSDTNAVDTEVALLRSPSLAARVVDSLELTADPELNPALDPDPSLIGALRQRLLGGETPERSPEQQREKVIQAFGERLSVQRDGLTYVIRLSFRSADPQKAAEIVNALADAYLVDQLEAKFDATERVNEWLSERLGDLRNEVAAAERAVAIYRSENGLTDVESGLLNDAQLSELNAQLILARTELAEDRARLRQVNELISSGESAETVAEAVDSETISQLRTQQAQVARRRADLASRYGERHPEMIRVNREISDLNDQIGAEIARIVASLQNEVAVSQERVRTLTGELNTLESRSNTDEQAMVQLRQLERDAEVVRGLYQSFLTRFRETSEGTTFQQADARVIAEASAPVEPSHPKSMLHLFIAVALGGMAGMGAAFLVEMLESGVKSSEEAETIFGAPVLASIPRLTGSLARKRMDGVVIEKPFSPYAESVRTLRTGLKMSNIDNEPQVVLITSSLPGEGKTTTAISLARSAAASGVKTILVDGDLRRGGILGRLRLAPEAGLIEAVTGAAPLSQAIVRDEESGADVLGMKGQPSHPEALLNSNAFSQLMADLRSRYDLIVIDAAPFPAVADTALLARQVDSAVFAVRWRSTSRKLAAATLDRIQRMKLPLAGLVLCQVNPRSRRLYGEGEAAYYYKTYRKYYS